MKVIRDLEQKRIFISSDDDQILMEFGFISDEFMIHLFASQVSISSIDDSNFYDCFSQLFQFDYQFQNPYSKKENQKIEWFSDGYCDFEDSYSVDSMNRLSILEKDNSIIFSCRKPIFEQLGVERSDFVVSFSPAGNGSFSRNLQTGTFFQDDVIHTFWDILKHNHKNKGKVYQRRNIHE